jgi:hypothetical protein
MAQDISIRDDGFAVSERGGNALIKGIIIKFADSVYRANKTEVIEQAPHGPTFMATGVVTAWVHWKAGKPIEHKITHTGQLHPYREDLGDDDKTEWELGIGEKPKDPWKDTRYLYLVDLRTGKTYTLVGDSAGMRQAAGELKDAIATVRLARPGALPVLQLATGSMPSQFGPRPRPDFKIIDWRGGGPTATAQAPQQIEQQAADADDDAALPDDETDFQFGQPTRRSAP